MSTDHASTDVAIVGAGVIGLAAGWRLAARGATVTVLERATPGAGTTRAAAGMIAAITETKPAQSSLLELARHSARAYPEFIGELALVSDTDPLYTRVGSVLVARNADEEVALDRERMLREELGLPVRRLRASEARALEPALGPTVQLGLEIPDDHAIDPRALAKALAEALSACGGCLRTGADVEAVIVTGDRVEGLRLAGGEEIRAGAVLIAAGPWSAALPGLPEHARVPLRPIKGQILDLHDPAGPGLLSRALRMQPGWLVPRGDGRYALGTTVEERGFDTTVTAGAVHGFLHDVIELVPGVREFVIDELLAGIRPGTPDDAPLIGPGALDGLFWATGHHRHGILLAPATAELVLGALGLTQPSAGANGDAFDPRRFETTELVGGVG